MTDDNSNTSDGGNNLVDMDDLDAFDNAFYNREPAKTEEVKQEDANTEGAEKNEIDENETSLETNEDKDASAQTEDDEANQAEPEKKPRKSAKERIDELTAEKYQARRELEILKEQVAKLTAGAQKTEVKTQAPDVRAQLDADAPNPDATNEDGSLVYPLGEFDPKFITDLTTYNVDKAFEAKAAKEAANKQAEETQAQQQQLQTTWAEKVAEAEKDIPDLRDSIEDLVDTFQGVEPRYGEYLATTIMQCENGPAILHYLSQNIGEAQKIVASGPHVATLEIGKLEARFSKPAEEGRNTKSMSNAPKPPVAQARGTGGRFQTPGDTDDLDAFERTFFKT